MSDSLRYYQEWFKKADHDERAAIAILKFYEEPPTPRIHDLVVLYNFIKKKDTVLNLSIDDLEMLNQYYIEAKYPIDNPRDYPKAEALLALEKATDLVRIVKENLASRP